MDDCIFCKIIKKNIPAKIIYEDEILLAFNDINPKANVHFLIIPKDHIISMLDLDKDKHHDLIANIMLMGVKLAITNGLHRGYKTHINTGINGDQEVPHLHVHIYGNK